MGRGVGLGLASVYGIVKSHKGIIQVYSNKGYGTTFSIYFPAVPGKPVNDQQEKVEMRRGSETILLVDDERAIINPTKLVLEHLGYRVHAAYSGNEALDIYRGGKETIDLVILDMIMPGMGGAETFYKLRNMDPEVKVVLSSGYSIGKDAIAIMNSGGKAFIQKPFKFDQLSIKLREVLEEG